MKSSFLKCMRLIYPTGVLNVEQLASMIHIWAFAWNEALIANGHTSGVKADCIVTAEVCNADFIPDESWKWWKGPFLDGS
jgi:hypothetical protein